MPKCPICGKRFDTLSALREHHRAVHPKTRFAAPKTVLSRNLLVGMIIVLVVVGSLIGYLIYTQSISRNPVNTGETALINQPIPGSLYSELSGVSSSTLASVGSGQGVASTNVISGTNLTDNGKPEVLYIGAEYCPYCAAERWAMIIALSKFGTFTGIEYMLSSSSDVYPNTPTFTFVGANYTSSYISFVHVESEDRSENVLQTPTSSEQALETQYDPVSSTCTSGGCIPFIDFGNQYSVVGAQYSPIGCTSGCTISNLNWTQVAAQLNTPSSAVAKAIDGTANTIITAICKIDGGSPSSVCSQSFAKVTAYTTPSSQSSSQQFLVLPQEEQRGVPKSSSLGF